MAKILAQLMALTPRQFQLKMDHALLLEDFWKEPIMGQVMVQSFLIGSDHIKILMKNIRTKLIVITFLNNIYLQNDQGIFLRYDLNQIYIPSLNPIGKSANGATDIFIRCIAVYLSDFFRCQTEHIRHHIPL